jgi:hypothetical protein
LIVAPGKFSITQFYFQEFPKLYPGIEFVTPFLVDSSIAVIFLIPNKIKISTDESGVVVINEQTM